MEFRDLSYVIAIAEYQNLSRASEKLYVSQPTLTKFLQKLESQLGQPLFDRMGNRFVLNYAGQCYVDEAKKILAIKDGLEKKLYDIKKENIGTLNIGIPILRSSSVIPQVLPEFSKKYPNISIQLHEEDSATLEKMLLDGSIDFAAYSFSERKPDLEYIEIEHEEILLAMSADHPLVSKGEVRPGYKYPFFDISLAQNENFILASAHQHIGIVTDEIFRSAGIKPKVILVTKNKATAIALSSRGYGMTLLKSAHLRTFHDRGNSVRFFSVEKGTLPSYFGVIYRKRTYVPQYMKDFILLIAKNCAEAANVMVFENSDYNNTIINDKPVD